MTSEQCKNCKWSFIDVVWVEGLDDELWWYDCDNENVKDIDAKLDYLDDIICPHFEERANIKYLHDDNPIVGPSYLRVNPNL